ncbi:response regulator transcription factor [Ktedonobacter racemifer]|uniref:Response regulator receiver protein n=1 Tax=Ktedonobacter racemifer DSM 44963 TaxID=485913 RepID=D6TRX9_KTERA|nr:response regulator [Ktedonobacter racemifer]EFH86052.1 response regulator receiver protein [Ktedonobacter racemifer DSM 44963]
MQNSQTRILLVEDDAVLSEVIGRNLQARHYRVDVAYDGHTALTFLRDNIFDLIFLDIDLPGHTGWEVLRIASREGFLPACINEAQRQVIPVVVLSAVRVSLERLAEFQLLAYLPKPFPMETLLRFASQAAIRNPSPPRKIV